MPFLFLVVLYHPPLLCFPAISLSDNARSSGQAGMSFSTPSPSPEQRLHRYKRDLRIFIPLSVAICGLAYYWKIGRRPDRRSGEDAAPVAVPAKSR